MSDDNVHRGPWEPHADVLPYRPYAPAARVIEGTRHELLDLGLMLQDIANTDETEITFGGYTIRKTP